MGVKMGVWLLAGMIVSSQVCASEISSDQQVMSESEWLLLANKRNCLYCHETEKDGLGPSQEDIAMEYAGQEDAEEQLFLKVYFGGVGKWGSTMMPAQNPPATQAEIRALVRYMLKEK